MLIAKTANSIKARKELRQRYQLGNGKPDAGPFDEEKAYALQTLRRFIQYLKGYKNSPHASRNSDQENDLDKLEASKLENESLKK